MYYSLRLFRLPISVGIVPEKSLSEKSSVSLLIEDANKITKKIVVNLIFIIRAMLKKKNKQ